MVISTRHFNPETDTGIILDTMPKSIYYDSHPRKGRPSQKWFEQFHAYLTDLLKDAVVIMAVSDDDPNLIMGYAVFSESKLVFIYVKDAYRKQGIATMLSNEYPFQSFNEQTMTKMGRQILHQKKQHKENLLAKPTAAKSELAEKSDQLKPAMTEQALTADQLDRLIATGFEVQQVLLQSAMLSGFNAAEFQFSQDSSNKMRKPDKLYWTQAGVVVDQNGHRDITPLANVIKARVY